MINNLLIGDGTEIIVILAAALYGIRLASAIDAKGKGMRSMFGIVMTAAIAIGSIAFAAAPAVTQEAEIARAEQYLSSLTTVTADFIQTNADGGQSKGKFYLKRPGKMRWQYAPPTPILLVSDGKVVTYYDAELDQISYVGLDDTLAGFLAQKTIVFNGPTTRLTQFESEAGTIRATLVQKAKPDEGSLTLEFSDKPLQLRQMVIKDATGHESRVFLQNAVFGTVLEDTLFTFEDPRGMNRRKGH